MVEYKYKIIDTIPIYKILHNLNKKKSQFVSYLITYKIFITFEANEHTRPEFFENILLI